MDDSLAYWWFSQTNEFVKLRPKKAPNLRRNLQLVNFLLWSPGRSPNILPHWHALPISQIKVDAHWLMTCGFDIRPWSKGRPSCGPPIPMSKRMWPWWGLTSWRAGKRQLATWWTISLPLDKGSPGLQSSADIWLSRRIWPKGLGFRILYKIIIPHSLQSLVSCCQSNSLALQSGSRMPTRYMPAGEIATQRNLLVHPQFTQLHPGLSEILRCAMAGGWKLYEAFWQMSVYICSIIRSREP